MKIGIDARLWNESGVGRYIRNLVLNLQIIDKKNTYVLFVNQSFEDGECRSADEAGKMENAGLPTRQGRWRIVKTNIHWHTFEEQLNFPQLLNKENLDLMHFPYFSVPIFYNKPFIVTIHDLIIDHFDTGEASKLFLLFYKIKHLGYNLVVSQTIKNAQKIIAVSYTTKDEITHHFNVDKNKIIVTYEGIDQNIKNLTDKTPFIKNPYFLYVGNAYPHKNLQRLIQAFNEVLDNKRLEDLKLVLIGKEDYFYQKLKEKVRDVNLNNSIIFYGQADDKKLANLYQNAKALIIPSLMEGFGLPAIEAMGNRCLVLASDILSLHEICRDSAIYFDPHDVQEMRGKMELVYFNDSNNFNKKIEKGFKRAKEFSWEKMTKETLKIYENSVGLR